MDTLEFVVLALGVFRLARLIVTDTILDTPRLWLLERFPSDETIFLEPSGNRIWSPTDDGWIAVKPHPVGQLISCVWCSGFWIAAIVTVLWWAYPEIVGWIMLPFALSATAGIIEEVT